MIVMVLVAFKIYTGRDCIFKHLTKPYFSYIITCSGSEFRSRKTFCSYTKSL